MLTVHKQTVLVHPIIDEFYDEDHDRSAVLAVSKGLVSKAPGTTVGLDCMDANVAAAISV
jgi:glutamine amidotransferase